MKLLTRDTDYAIRALCYIAKREKGLISVPELVQALKIPKPFLRKILQVLNKENFLRSYKGQGGGFKLNRTADEIFITDLIQIFQGDIKLSEHLFKTGVCPNINNCRLKKKIDKIEKYIISELRETSLASLL